MIHRIEFETGDKPAVARVAIDGQQVMPKRLTVTADANSQPLAEVTLVFDAYVDMDALADLTVTQDAPDPSLTDH